MGQILVVLGACCTTKQKEERGVIGTSFIVLIQGITVCSLLGGYHLFGSTLGELVANSLVPPLLKILPFSQRKKRLAISMHIAFFH
jgi:hypothetical protein